VTTSTATTAKCTIEERRALKETPHERRKKEKREKKRRRKRNMRPRRKGKRQGEEKEGKKNPKFLRRAPQYKSLSEAET
jgi:squalene cyclase